MGQRVSAHGFQSTAINDLLSRPPLNNAPLSTTNRGPESTQDKKYSVPQVVIAPVKSGDSPAKLKWRALYGAAQEAGLPPADRKNFADAYFKTSIKWTDADPSPEDNTKELKSNDLKAGETVNYKLSDGEIANLKLRQTNYQLAGGKLGSNQNLPSAQDQAKGRNGFDQTELKRRQIEQSLPQSGGTGQTNAIAGTPINSADLTPNATVAPSAPLKPLSEYIAAALKLIQKPGTNNVTDQSADVRQRNGAITGAYADLYLKNPEAFGWIGAAAYASGQVGFAMDQALPMPDMTGVNDPTGDFTAAAGAIGTVTSNIKEMLGKGNITIFSNIYPASLAYQNGGIEELRRIENSLPPGEEKNKFIPIRLAYEQIDDGVKLNKINPGAGNQKIKDGTNAIIDFEQDVVLQPIFNEYENTVKLITPFAFGDLDADDTKTDAKTFSRFYQPKSVVLSADTDYGAIEVTNLGASFGNSNLRRRWIKEDVFPLWDTKRTQRPDEVKREMQTIVERGRAAGGQY